MQNSGFRQRDEVKFRDDFSAELVGLIYVIEYFGTDNTGPEPRRFAQIRLKRNARAMRLAYLDDLVKA
jgi:hypothetical protein